MFSNIGRKIKTFAVVICVLGIAVSFFFGIYLISLGMQTSSYPAYYSSEVSGIASLAGFLVIIFGSLISWISSWQLYGFGELVEKSGETAENTRILVNILANQHNVNYSGAATPTNQYGAFASSQQYGGTASRYSNAAPVNQYGAAVPNSQNGNTAPAQPARPSVNYSDNPAQTTYTSDQTNNM